MPHAKWRSALCAHDTERRQWNQTLPQEEPCRAPAKQTGDERRNEYPLSQRRRSTQSAPSEEAAFGDCRFFCSFGGLTPNKQLPKKTRVQELAEGKNSNFAPIPKMSFAIPFDGKDPYGHRQYARDVFGYARQSAPPALSSTYAFFFGRRRLNLDVV